MANPQHPLPCPRQNIFTSGPEASWPGPPTCFRSHSKRNQSIVVQREPTCDDAWAAVTLRWPPPSGRQGRRCMRSARQAYDYISSTRPAHLTSLPCLADRTVNFYRSCVEWMRQLPCLIGGLLTTILVPSPRSYPPPILLVTIACSSRSARYRRQN
jgi:hypothetical protein